MIRVFIAEKTKKLPEVLTSIINKSGVAIVKDTFHTLKECREKLTFPLGVLLLGLNLPDGDALDFCTEIRRLHPGIRVLMLLDREEYSVIKQALDNGASGYIFRNAIGHVFISGIQAVMDNKIYLGDKIDIPVEKEDNIMPLTPEEENIIKLIQEGKSDPEIAAELSLHIKAVETYRQVIMMKLFTNGYSNMEIAGQLSLDLKSARMHRMDFIDKLRKRGSMVMLAKDTDVIELTPAEIKLLNLIVVGYTNKEMAAKLNNSVETIKTSRRDLIDKFKKLGPHITGTIPMLMEALTIGLIKLKDIRNL